MRERESSVAVSPELLFPAFGNPLRDSCSSISVSFSIRASRAVSPSTAVAAVCRGDMEGAFDSRTTSTVKKIPLLKTKAGPRDEEWQARLKEELTSLIAYVKWNKSNDNDWFTVSPTNKEGALQCVTRSSILLMS